MKKKLYIGLAIVFSGLLAAVAYYAISPLFINIAINEVEPAAIDTTVVTKNNPVIDTPTHPASGSASILKTSSGNILRYENFKTINGPDLYVYLSTDTNATEYVSLGKLRATEGNVNYEIPAEVDLDKYRYSLVWCQRFGVLFNHVDLQEKGS